MAPLEAGLAAGDEKSGRPMNRIVVSQVNAEKAQASMQGSSAGVRDICTVILYVPKVGKVKDTVNGMWSTIVPGKDPLHPNLWGIDRGLDPPN